MEYLVGDENVIYRTKLLIMMYTGDGKTHYILDRLRKTCSRDVTIPIHEGFSYERVIKILRALPLTSYTNNVVYGVFFNFTMCYQKVMLADNTLHYVLIFCFYYRNMTNYLTWLVGFSSNCWFLELFQIINQLQHFDYSIKQRGISTLRCYL